MKNATTDRHHQFSHENASLHTHDQVDMAAFTRNPAGLSSTDALTYLNNILLSSMNHASFSRRHVVYWRAALDSSVFGPLLSSILLLVLYLCSETSLISDLFSCILLSFISLISFIVLCLRNYFITERLYSKLQYVQDILLQVSSDSVNHDNSFVPPPSSACVLTLRDSAWRLLPHVCLVPGDVIELSGSALAPTAIEPIPSPSSSFTRPLKAQQCLDALPSQRAQFYVLKAPLDTHITSLIQHHYESKSRCTSLEIQRCIITARILLSSAVIIVMCAIFSGLCFLVPDLSKARLAVAIEAPFLCVLPLLGIYSEVLRSLLDALGNALLIDCESSLRHRVSHDYEDEHKQVQRRLCSAAFISLWGRRRQALTAAYNVLIGRINANTLDALGGVTVVCALDKNGLLAHVFSTAEHVLVQENNAPIVIDVIPDRRTRNGIVLEDDWIHHLASVKPVGLSCMLSASCAAAQTNAFHCNLPEYSAERPRLPSVEAAKRNAVFARQCLCYLGQEVGFESCMIESQFCKVQLLHNMNRLDDGALQHMNSVLVRCNDKDRSLQLFSRGDPSYVLNRCQYIWNGEQVVPFASALKQQIGDILRRWVHDDLTCVAFSYTPIATDLISILESDVMSESSNQRHINVDSNAQQALSDAESNQIFLGLVSMRQQPKPEVPLLVDDLTQAGIRFVMFSSANRTRSIAFAEKIGLETDWNFFISLQEPDHDPNLLCEPIMDVAPNISMLPEGISAIKPHLALVDNVPLLVSLFTDSTPYSTLEMIRILQENGEHVLCVASSIDDANFEALQLSEFGVAMQPLPGVDHTTIEHHTIDCSTNTILSSETQCVSATKSNATITKSHSALSSSPSSPSSLLRNNSINSISELSEFCFAEAITSLPCPYPRLHHSANIRSYVSGMISQGRRLLVNVRQAGLFAIASFVATSCINILCILLGLPPVFRAYHILWLVWLIIPLITLSLMFTSADTDIMQYIPKKINDEMSRFKYLLLYFALRFVPTVFFCTSIFLWMLRHHYGAIGDWVFTRYHYQQISTQMNSIHLSSAIAMAQHYALFTFVYCLCCISMGFVNRFSTLRQRSPFSNGVWCFTICLILCLQLIFSLVSVVLNSDIALISTFGSAPALAVVIILWPAVLQCTDEISKRHDRAVFRRQQQRLRIVFGTKLGMHSPR